MDGGYPLATEQITISVDSEAARAYRGVSAEDRRKLDLLLSLRIKDATRSGRPLLEVMDEIAARAQDRGLTPEALRAILDEE
jgi:hypothetical protein